MSSRFKVQSSKFTSSKSVLAVLFLVLAAYCFPLTVSAQKTRLIFEIQGDKNVSPYEGERVRVVGIVTARTRSGFFIQMPDNINDENPATSDGIYIYTKNEPGGEAALGNSRFLDRND